MARKLKCYLINKGYRTLSLKNKRIEAGILDERDQPQSTLSPGETMTWTVTSDADIRGWILFEVSGADDASMFEVDFDDPQSGQERFVTIHRLPKTPVQSPLEATLADAQNQREVTFAYEEPDQGPTLPRLGPPPSVVEVVAACDKRAHVSLATTGRKAMICPAGDVTALKAKIRVYFEGHAPQPTVPEGSRVWAEQWMQADRTNRRLWFVTEKQTFDDFVATAKEAAAWVGSGEVVLMAGHGGAGGFRGLKETAFDTIPEAEEAFSKHVHRVTSTMLFELERTAEKIGDAWTWKVLPGGVKPTGDKFPNKEELKVVGHKWEKLGELGEAFKSSKLALFTVLSCNTGRKEEKRGDDDDFGSKLAQRLQCGVRLFTMLVAVGEKDTVDAHQKKAILEQIWLTYPPNLQTGRPNTNDPTAESFHEIPNHDQKLWDLAGRPCG